MGEVYRARDPSMGREVAIKVSAERFSDGFEREVRAVAALNHPNSAAIHGLAVIDGLWWSVQQCDVAVVPQRFVRSS